MAVYLYESHAPKWSGVRDTAIYMLIFTIDTWLATMHTAPRPHVGANKQPPTRVHESMHTREHKQPPTRVHESMHTREHKQPPTRTDNHAFTRT